MNIRGQKPPVSSNYDRLIQLVSSHCEKQVLNAGLPELSEFVIVTENNISKNQENVIASQPRTRNAILNLTK